MMAFSTLAEPHMGHATSPRADWRSNAVELLNQLSKVWPASQQSA
jgi:hypothetical protein